MADLHERLTYRASWLTFDLRWPQRTSAAAPVMIGPGPASTITNVLDQCFANALAVITRYRPWCRSP
jgi:hypothetical protein